MSKKPILVAGGGGFIGGHLVARLLKDGYQVRSVDIKPMDEWYQVFDDAENVIADLKQSDSCHKACAGVSDVYCLAADMGGMGFIENNKALCMLSVLINTHLLQAARRESRPLLLRQQRLRLQCRQAKVGGRDSAQGGRRLSRDA